MDDSFDDINSLSYDNSDESSNTDYSVSFDDDNKSDYYKCGFQCKNNIDSFDNTENDNEIDDYYYLNLSVPYNIDIDDLKILIQDQIDTINSVLDNKYYVTCDSVDDIILEKINSNFNGKVDYEIEEEY